MKSYLNQNNLTRGVRNNNPGNIERSSSAWVGKIPYPQSKDSRFEQFTFLEYGIRALFITLRTYRNKHGLKTINGIVNRFAPSNENNTSSYMDFLSQELNLERNATIPDTKQYRFALAKAIIQMEIGINNQLQYVTDESIKKGYDLAYGGNTTIEELTSGVSTPQSSKMGNLLTILLLTAITIFAIKI